jgi:uncharacterized protein YkwD
MLQRQSVYKTAILCLSVLISFFGLIGCVNHDIVIKENLQKDLLGEINKLRHDGCICGQDTMPPVPVLIWNNALEAAAHNHASDMYYNNYFSHLSLDGSSPIMRAQRSGYEGEYVGEDIARGYKHIADVMDAWVASESHCKAIMDTLYMEAGASQVYDYWVLDFGRQHN